MASQGVSTEIRDYLPEWDRTEESEQADVTQKFIALTLAFGGKVERA